MKQLPQEAIEAIEPHEECYYQDYGVNRNTKIRSTFMVGATEALTNPEIYSKAGFILLEDAYNFFNWTIDSKWYMIKKNNWYNPRIDKKEENTLTTTQLFQIYQESKNDTIDPHNL